MTRCHRIGHIAAQLPCTPVSCVVFLLLPPQDQGGPIRPGPADGPWLRHTGPLEPRSHRYQQVSCRMALDVLTLRVRCV
jgi:hypothetical protein